MITDPLPVWTIFYVGGPTLKEMEVQKIFKKCDFCVIKTPEIWYMVVNYMM